MKTSPKQTKAYRSAVGTINAWVKKNSSLLVVYEFWYVGVTNDPQARARAHKSKNAESPYFWLNIDTKSRVIALEVEKHFHSKGMLEKDLTGGVAGDTTHVYVYKKHATLIDVLS